MQMSETQKTDTEETPVERYKRLRRSLQAEASNIMQIISGDYEDHPLIGELQAIQQDLDDDSFKIGLFGVTAAGKSTLTNAMLGESMLREGLGETTRTLTKICASDSDHPHGQVLIEFKTMEQIYKELEQHLKKTGFGFSLGAAVNLDDPAFRAAIQDQINDSETDDLELAASCRFMNHLLKGWDECRDRLGEIIETTIQESDQFVHQEHVATFVALRTLYYDNAITRDGFVFYDGPGIASSYARHTDEAVSLAQRVDAAVIVTRVDYKFMPPDRRFLREAMDLQRMQERHNLIFVLNQIQKIDPLQSDPPREPDRFDECVQEQVEKLRDRLHDFGIEGAPIYPVDAACGQWARMLVNQPEDKTAALQLQRYGFPHCLGDVRKNLTVSRIVEFEQGLMKHLATIRYYGFLANRLDRLKSLNFSYKTEKTQILSYLTESLAALQKELDRHVRNKEETEQKLREYLDYVLPARIDEEYKDLHSDISEVVDRSLEALMDSYSRDYSMTTYEGKKFWNDVVKKASPTIRELIKKIRDEYEGKYAAIRDEALENRIPHIVATYGEEANFDFTKSDLKEAVELGIGGLEGIALDAWQEVKATLCSLFWYERRKELLGEYLRKNYHERFAEQFRQDITGWVEKDRDGFGEQVMAKFDQLMAQMEARIKSQFDLAQKTEAERQTAEEKLMLFIRKLEQSAGNLQELEEEIQKAKPSSLYTSDKE